MPAYNFFNNHFYGRARKRDFTEADLPSNRLQLFRDVLGVRRGSMVGVNLLYLLCWIPAIAWTFLNLVQLYLLPSEDIALLGAYFHQLLRTYLFVLSGLIAITGPFNMGISFVMRNWARDEHSFVLSDFASALKKNWKQGLLFGIIDGLVPLLVYIGVSTYLGMAQDAFLFYLPLAIVVIAAVIWWLSAAILPTMIVTYQQGFFTLVRNAVLMTLAKLPQAIGIKLATLAVPILTLAGILLFPSALGWISAAAVALYAIFLLAFNKLLCASHANALCETYLNPKIDGARTNIGLHLKHETEEKK